MKLLGRKNVQVCSFKPVRFAESYKEVEKMFYILNCSVEPPPAQKLHL